MLQPNNRKILAYLRIYGEEIILCVASFSETPQAAEFSLAKWAGRLPVDLFGAARFPAVTGAPYTVTLTGHGFFWLKLLTPAEADARQAVPLEAMDRPHLPEPDRPAPGRPRG